MSAHAHLAGKLDFPDSQRLITILEHILTPEQAAIADSLPGTPNDVADKLGMNPVTAPCLCRLENKTAGVPCRHTNEEAVWKCLQFGKGADYVIVRGVGKQLTQEEAFAMADRAEEDALVHIWGVDRKMQGQISCQCCDDCCLNFLTAKENNVSIERTYLKSRYAASIDQDKCSGCQECVERCNFEAIDMVRQGKKYKAAVDAEKCWGCGVCVLKCDTGALKMQTVRPVDYIPETVVAT